MQIIFYDSNSENPLKIYDFHSCRNIKKFYSKYQSIQIDFLTSSFFSSIFEKVKKKILTISHKNKNFKSCTKVKKEFFPLYFTIKNLQLKKMLKYHEKNCFFTEQEGKQASNE
jgi:hypothetical protein